MGKNKQKSSNKGNEHARKQDAEMLDTTDPQEHMKGPVSSIMQKTKDGVDHNDNTEKEKKKHDEKKKATGGDFINN